MSTALLIIGCLILGIVLGVALIGYAMIMYFTEGFWKDLGG